MLDIIQRKANVLRTVKFYRGVKEAVELDEIQLDVDDSRMLVAALKAIVPGFKSYAKDNPHISVVVEGARSSSDNIESDTQFAEAHTIHIADTIEGEFAAGFFVSLGFSTFAATIISFVLNTIISQVISSIAQSLAPKPKTDKGTGTQTHSFIFNQIINSTNEGDAVPIIYGTTLVGSKVIASDVKTVDIAV